MTRGADVRISGVSVGKVVAVGRFGQRTDATIELESQHAPIPADTRAIVRSKTLLGEAFVELSPGDRTAPKLDDGGRLPARQVAPTQALDQVLSGFDERTRLALRRFVSELAVAVDGRGQDLNSALGHAEPAAANLDRLVRVLDLQRAEVRGLVRDSATVLAAVGRREGDLQGLVTAGNDVLSTTAARNRELTETVRALPGFLVDLRGSLRRLDRAGAKVAPDVRTLRALAPQPDRLAHGARRAHARVRRVLRGAAPRHARGQPRPARRHRHLQGDGAAVRRRLPRQPRAGPDLLLLQRVRNGHGELVREGGRRHRGHQRGPALPAHAAADHQREPGRRRRTGRPPTATTPTCTRAAWATSSSGGLRAFGCANTSNPVTLPPIGSAPACREAGPWTFRGNHALVPARRARRSLSLATVM